jgi:SAM-dependent methyltransferase
VNPSLTWFKTLTTVFPAVIQFYKTLQEELINGNPFLQPEEQTLLSKHRPLIVDPGHYSPELVAVNYVNRRSAAAEAIQGSRESIVFDAGCGYGSDSLFFASLGARVLSVDFSPENIDIAKKRKDYYEQKLDMKLSVKFLVADLNDYVPEITNLSLTWISSVLAVIEDQDNFLRRIYEATKPEGQIVITDFNLVHLPFLLGEWWRRHSALRDSPEFATNANFLNMVRRYRRQGARYYPFREKGSFDDVQFFTPGSLARLLRAVGFRPLLPQFSGFVPPLLPGKFSVALENFLSELPVFRHLGRAYVMTGLKE